MLLNLAHRRVEGVSVHVARDALDEVLERHRGTKVGAVAGALVGSVVHQGTAVGQLRERFTTDLYWSLTGLPRCITVK